MTKIIKMKRFVHGNLLAVALGRYYFLFNLLIGCIILSFSSIAIGQYAKSESIDPPHFQQTENDLIVSINVETEFKRIFGWAIEKTATPDTWDFFEGDEGTTEYVVQVNMTDSTDCEWKIGGQIQITNPGPGNILISSVSQQIENDIPTQINTTIRCPYLLAPGESINCNYGAAVAEGKPGHITTTILYDNEKQHRMSSNKTEFSFDKPTSKVNDEVIAEDSWTESVRATKDTTIVYYKTFSCADAGTNINRVNIVGGPSDSAIVTVRCHKLEISKTANTQYDRKYFWRLYKIGWLEEVTLSPGQIFTMYYYCWPLTRYEDMHHAVSGEIKVLNGAPVDAVINGVSDLITPDIVASVSCSVAFPYTLSPGDSIICTYQSDLEDKLYRRNTATATLQNHSFDKNMNATPTSTMDYSVTITFGFEFASVELIDESINLYDNMLPPPGFIDSIHADDLPYRALYLINIGPYDDTLILPVQDFTNIAWFQTHDTGETGFDSYTLEINLTSSIYDPGCTFSDEYWGTHSKYGPEPYDPDWEKLEDVDGDGYFEYEDEIFFASEQTYYQVLNTNPSGNIYYLLAPQYIATELNFLNGADPTDATDAFDEAAAMLSGKTPSSCLNMGAPEKEVWKKTASILNDYNNGLIGPGYCEVDGSSKYPDLQHRSKYTQEAIKSEYILMQNYPNPLSRITNFSFSIPETSMLEVNIYSLSGKMIASVFRGILNEGVHSIEYTLPSDIPPGIYIYSLETPRMNLFRKMNVN